MNEATSVQAAASALSDVNVERVVIERHGKHYRIVLHVIGEGQAKALAKARGGMRTWKDLDRAVGFAESRWPDVSPYLLRLRPSPAQP